MFQEMLNGSIAVLSRPSVATFEEYEKDNLGWALIYTLIGAVLGVILATLRAAIFPDPALEQAGDAAGGAIFGAVIGVLIASTIGFFIYYGIVYGLGRAFGGTGSFGELAYDMALFAVPLGVASNLLSLIPIVGGFVGFILWLYSLYLTYLGIQSGMNLPGNKALYVILILAAIGIVIVACFAFFVVAIIAALSGSGSFN